MNATLTIEFPDFTDQFDIEWIGDGIDNSEELWDEIFCSERYDSEWDQGNVPNMTVTLKDDPSISSRVIQESEAGMIFPTRDLNKLLG